MPRRGHASVATVDQPDGDVTLLLEKGTAQVDCVNEAINALKENGAIDAIEQQIAWPRLS